MVLRLAEPGDELPLVGQREIRLAVVEQLAADRAEGVDGGASHPVAPFGPPAFDLCGHEARAAAGGVCDEGHALQQHRVLGVRQRLAQSLQRRHQHLLRRRGAGRRQDVREQAAAEAGQLRVGEHLQQEAGGCVVGADQRGHAHHPAALERKPAIDVDDPRAHLLCGEPLGEALVILHAARLVGARNALVDRLEAGRVRRGCVASGARVDQLDAQHGAGAKEGRCLASRPVEHGGLVFDGGAQISLGRELEAGFGQQAWRLRATAATESLEALVAGPGAPYHARLGWADGVLAEDGAVHPSLDARLAEASGRGGRRHLERDEQAADHATTHVGNRGVCADEHEAPIGADARVERVTFEQVLRLRERRQQRLAAEGQADLAHLLELRGEPHALGRRRAGSEHQLAAQRERTLHGRFTRRRRSGLGLGGPVHAIAPLPVWGPQRSLTGARAGNGARACRLVTAGWRGQRRETRQRAPQRHTDAGVTHALRSRSRTR